MALNETIIINSRFKLVEKLSEGSFGHLFRSEDLLDNKKIKTVRVYSLKPNEDIENAKSNVTKMQQFISPYLVQYLDSYHEKELKNFYVVMDNYDDTKSLEVVLDEYQKEKSPLSNDQIQFWSIQILKGLEFLHKSDIIHRSIKPMNIFLRDEDIILGELGLERDPNVMTEQHLEAGVGTLNYMAPEIIKNYINYTRKIDIWSFGCVLYEMIYLKRLAEGRKAKVISFLINFKDHKLKLENTLPLFVNTLKKCLILQPETRQTTTNLLEILMKDFTIPPQGFKRIKKYKQKIPHPPPKIVKSNNSASEQPTGSHIVPSSASSKSKSPSPTEKSHSSVNVHVPTAPMSPVKRIFSGNNRVSPLSAQQFRSESADFSLERYLEEADNLFRLSNYNEALKYYDKAIELKPECSESCFKKGRCLRGILQYEQSIEYFDRALKLDETNLSAYNYKAFSLKAISRNEEANVLFEEALRRNENPQDANSFFNKALSFHGLKKYEEAIEFYNKAIEIDFSDAFFYNSKGILLKSMNRFHEAIECYDKAIQLEPNYAYAYNNKGLLMYSLNKNIEAIECFDNAIKLYRDYADAYKNKANSLFELKKYEEAILMYSKALELDPKCTNTYNNMGNTYSFMNKYKEAIECYDKLIQFEATSIDAHRNKAILLKEMNMLNEALYCYECILSIQPDNLNALENKRLLMGKILSRLMSEIL